MADAELVQENESTGPDEIDAALEEMLEKYKKSTDQKSRFMMVDDVLGNHPRGRRRGGRL